MRVITPAPRDVWLDVLESATAALIYQTPLGVEAACAEYGWEDVSRLYEFPDGRQVILPLMRTSSRPDIFAVETTPSIGSLISRGPVRAGEIAAIFADLANRRLLRTRLTPSPLEAETWESAVPRQVIRIPRTSHVLELENDFDTVWKERFNGQARRACRKAEKADLEIEHDTRGGLVDEFYELYTTSVERWAKSRGEPVSIARWRAGRRMPLANLKRRVAVLGDSCHLWLARVAGRPAAAIMVLQGANAHYTLGAMDQDLAGPVRASFHLQKLAIETACQAGCRYYGMGSTGTSATLARFKEHFGAVAYRYSEYRIERFPATAISRRLSKLARGVMKLRRR